MGERLIHDELEKQSYWRPDALAMVYEGTAYTYREFDERVNRTARALADRGIGSGDRVLAHGVDHVDWYTLFYACSKLGATYCPVSRFQSRSNLRYIVDRLDPAVVFYTAGPDIVDRVETIREEAAVPYWTLDSGADVNDPTFDALLDGHTHERPAWAEDPSPDTDHNVLWTSGTTGRPKAVLRDHRSSLHFSDNLINDLPFRAWNTRVTTNSMMLLDAYFHYGLPTVMAGGTNVMMREYSPERLYELYESHGVNSLHLGFTMSRLVLEYLEETDRTLDLRYLTAVIPSSNFARSLWQHTETLYHIYGTTEIGLPLVKRIEPPFDSRPSLGKPGISAQVRVCPEDSDEVPSDPPAVGDTGELACRGETTMKRYMDPETQAAKVHNGWIRPGDVVRVNENRDLVFLGRTDDRLRSGGVNVYPSDVEDVLEEHPAVENAIVVGVDDEKWGDRISALVIVGDADVDGLAERIDSHCRQHEGIADEIRPRDYAFVASNEDVPMGAQSKPDRGAIVDQFFT